MDKLTKARLNHIIGVIYCFMRINKLCLLVMKGNY